MHPDDRRQVVGRWRVRGVVSNHGGRQVGRRARRLPAVVATVGDRADVLFDSGIRTGSDMLIALVLGAKAVLYGRPWAYVLGIAGREGVRHALRVLLADFDAAMGLSGCASPAELAR
ncbi:alpha-hydroxy-acid oxidizing protein [Nocardia sp. CA-129566]|uniref:alpha-hydroxy-acid oxidizing protein n=1 Tax=Nocardia sp. CA-129566 TaxID=3239976 RepID=UPI003D9762D5